MTSSLAGIIKNAFLLPDSNIESGTPYSDLTIPDTIVVVSQPEGQVCAVVGGIHAVRMKILGARGVLVDGRVRDLSTLVELGIPVWSKATSTIGSAAEARAWAAGVPVKVGAVTVNPVWHFPSFLPSSSAYLFLSLISFSLVALFRLKVFSYLLLYFDMLLPLQALWFST